jgi:hypothetical protein
VTIYGVGFSATAASNVVTFNGIATTVSSATTTKLVTIVPTGATTGPISVTVGTKTASSAEPFTVTTGPVNASPVIASFTPTIGTFGTPVTISGQYFEPAPTNNIVRFNNVTRAAVATSTLNAIGTTVPIGTTSGHISVRTPYGAATSAQDFFVLPTGYTSAQVGVTTRMEVDGPELPINTGIPGKIAMVLFEGIQGQNLGLGINPVTFTPAGVATLYVKTSLGDDLMPPQSFSGPNSFDWTNKLPATGTYTIIIVPSATSSLSATLTLSSDITGTLAANGAAQAFTTTRVGQNARYSFSGTAAQNLSLLFSGDTFPGGTTVRVYRPDGLQLAVATVNYSTGAGSAGTLDLNNLPVTGTYTVFVTPVAVATGAVNLNLRADVAGALAAGGAATAVSVTAGQNARYTFTGAVGEGWGLGIPTVATTPAGGAATVSVYKPDNSLLLTCGTFGVAGGSCDLPVLPVAGTYTVLVNAGVNAATLSLLLSADVTGTLIKGGATLTFTTTRVGQNARYSFNGTAAQTLSVVLSGDTFPGTTYVYVYKPDGVLFASKAQVGSIAGTAGTLTLTNLPITGTYTVFITPSGISIGTIQVRIP